jgi:hypothetical protein
LSDADVVEDLYSWISRWAGDIMNLETVRKSIVMASTLLQEFNYFCKFYADTVVKLVRPAEGKSIFEQSSAFILYQWEATVEHMRLALCLALSANYNSAFTLLRNSLELLIKGAFYECLAHKNYREGVWKLSVEDDASKLREELLKKLLDDPDEEQKLEENSVRIFDLISGLLYDYYPNFRKAVVPQLIWWNLFHPLEKADRELNALYTKLSLDVHEHPDKTTVGRIIIQGGEPFESPQPLRESLDEFIQLLNRVMDIGTVLTLNVLRTKRDSNEVRIIVSQLISEHDLTELPSYPLTRRAVSAIIGT